MQSNAKNTRFSCENGKIKSSSGSSLMRNPLYAQVIIYVVLFLLACATLLPILNVLAQSFSPAHVIARRPFMLIPEQFTLEAYGYLFETSALSRAFLTSVLITGIGTGLGLLITVLAAYGLSKTHIPGNKILMKFIVLAMLFNAGIIPTYIVINKFLHLIDTYAVLVLPFLVNSYNIILMRNFFWSIPDELEQSTHIDGASDLQTLWYLILPLSKPAIATIGLFYAVGHWNDFYRGLIYLNDSTMWPLAMLMRSIVVDNQMTGMGNVVEAREKLISPDNIKAATIIFSTVPILMVYPFIQKHFTKGIMVGAIKG